MIFIFEIRPNSEARNRIRIIISLKIRFRASDFRSQKANLVRANRNRLLVRNRMRRWCSGHLFRCLEPTSTTATSGAAKRRAECTSLGPGLKASEPAPTDSILAAKRRAEALHIVFFSTKHPTPARWPTYLMLLLLLCLLSHDT